MSSRTGSGERWLDTSIRTADGGPRARLHLPTGTGMSAAGGRPPRRDGPGPDGGHEGGTDNPGWIIFGYLLAGMAVYGGLGWLIGRWAGHQPIFLAIGMVFGLGLAIAMTIYRYGRS